MPKEDILQIIGIGGEKGIIGVVVLYLLVATFLSQVLGRKYTPLLVAKELSVFIAIFLLAQIIQYDNLSDYSAKKDVDAKVDSITNNMQNNINGDSIKFVAADMDLKINTFRSATFYSTGSVKIEDDVKNIYNMQLIATALGDTIKNYLENNSFPIIRIVACGVADAQSVVGDSIWRGDNTPMITYYKSKDVTKQYPKKKQFVKGKTKMENIDFAVLRAYYVVEYFKKQFPIRDENVEIFVEESDKIGQEHRKCDFMIMLEGYFLKYYDELSWGARQYIPKRH